MMRDCRGLERLENRQTASQIACFHVILHWIRGLSIFFCGIVVVAMMDPHQLKPIKGEPTMLFALMMTAFNFHCLEHSVQAGRDWDLHRIQETVRMPPSSYTPNEFSDCVQGKCTSVVGIKRQEHENDLLDFIKKPNVCQ